MKKNRIWSLFLLFLFVFYFNSCEIGLGESVDTESPQISISTPQPDCIIRDRFKISGTWSDDGSIESIKIKLSRTDGKGSVKYFSADVFESYSGNTYECIIDPEKDNILDGDYIAQVNITDKGKHITTSSVQFAIDNTPPVIVLQRPASTEKSEYIDAYGRKLTLEGQAADDNNVSLIEVHFFKEDSNGELSSTPEVIVPINNVPNSINLDVAEFSVTNEEDNPYNKLYGNNGLGGTKKFYCKVVAYDGASCYPVDRNQTPDDLKGNKTDIYYLYEDIATEILDKVKITDVYDILSGVYSLENNSRAAVQNDKKIDEEVIKGTLKSKEIKTGAFTLNPDNSPTFTVVGREPLYKEDGKIVFEEKDTVTNGSSITIEVSPGLDNIPIDYEPTNSDKQLKPQFYEYNKISGEKEVNPIEIEDDCFKIEKSGSNYKITVNVDSTIGVASTKGFKTNRNYLIEVNGVDQKGNKICGKDGKDFGFVLVRNGNAPSLVVEAPENNQKISANMNVVVSGYTEIEGDADSESDYPAVTIYQTIENRPKEKIFQTSGLENGVFWIEDGVYRKFYFEKTLTLPENSSYISLDIESTANGKTTTRQKQIIYDKDAPIISINSVSPVVEENLDTETKKYLNGKVKVFFNLTDTMTSIDTSDGNKPYILLLQKSDGSSDYIQKKKIEFAGTAGIINETITIDTLELEDGKHLKIEVYAKDQAGNESVLKNDEYFIKQETDIPEVKPNGNIDWNLTLDKIDDEKENPDKKNKIAVGNNVNFTITDDDGIKNITLLKKEGDEYKEEKKAVYNGDVMVSYSFTLPSVAGFYEYKLVVEDLNYSENPSVEKNYNKFEKEFVIKAMAAAPFISVKADADYKKSNESYVNTITVNSVEKPFTLWHKKVGEEDYSELKVVENVNVTYEENEKGCVFTIIEDAQTQTETYFYKVKDSNGYDSNEVSVECKIDSMPPKWKDDGYPTITAAKSIVKIGGEDRNYYKSNSLTFKLKAVDDDSGVANISYSLDKGTEVITDNANFTIEKLAEGRHEITITATDAVGNSTTEPAIVFYVDTKSPLKPKLVSIDSESDNALTDYKNESKSKLVNGKNDVTFVLNVQDDSSKTSESDTEYNSGIKTVEVVKIASTSQTGISGQEKNDQPGQYKITIPKEKLATGSVSVRITDNVGNTYEGTVFNLQLDNTPPTLKINSPANNATVNKTITISGATTDNNAVADTVVTVKKDGNSVRTETFTAENSNELDWTLDLNTFVGDITNSAEKATLSITVTATDKANNTATEERTITVDQDSDRPKISFNNVTLGSSMGSSDSNYIWLKNTTVLYGTVEDDDGISSMQISKDGTNWKDVTLTKTSWSFDVKTFSESGTDEQKENEANGAHTIYFKVTDSKNQEFSSATSSSLTSVYLVDGNNKYGTIGSGSAKPDSILYVKVDTLAPEVVLTGARIGNSGDFSTSYSNMTLGGSKRTMQFKLTAKDGNGIESITGTAEFDGASITLSSPVVKAYKSGDSGDEETSVGASDAEYYIVSFTVDLTDVNKQKGLNGKDGRISLKFTGKDKAGNSSAQTATINYDYKKPEVTITSPKDSSWVSGIVTAYGTIDSTATMYYALSPSNTITPAEADSVSSGGNLTGQAESGTDNLHRVTSWSGIDPITSEEKSGTIDVTPKYSQIKGNGVQWFVYFDNQPSTDIATHDVEFKKYLTNYGITTDDDISNKSFTTIVNLYLWIKSIDEAGNITETSFPISIDPQGDAPQVEISYPAKSGETLGGAVTLLGTASDTIGSNIGIKNVWVQIMSDTKDTSTTPTKDDVNLWINNGYSVYTNIKNGEPTKVTTEIADSATPANYYIQATVSGTSWSLKINGKDEFSPSEGQTKHVAYRVYAQDNDNNLSKVQTQYCIFDADNPILSDLYLRQYDENGNITASRPYEDDMWIKGDWWLCGTVKDTQGIKSLTVGGENQNPTGNVKAEETFKYKISTNGIDAGNRKISIIAEDKAEGTTHKTEKVCSINFDNKAPVSKEPVIANNRIQNANGFFTFSAEVTEDAVGGATQSGFKYLAFYFTRGNNVYDIMRPKAEGKSAVDKSNTTNFQTEDGLIWKKLSVTRSSDNLAVITLDSADDNVHTGGLCKIGGSIYMIKNVNGTTIELDGSPEKPQSGNSQDALFAIANVVNNNIESGNGTKSTNDSYYGYFESISNDDGDHMVESVLKTGTTWKWEANINSRNIPDGTVTLHYVAFDAAGNSTVQKIENLQIANNAPRLASLKVWTDYNGNGQQDENEFDTKYYKKKTVVINGKSQTKSQDLTSDLLLSGNDKDDFAGGSAFMTIKAETKLIPELVGGNGDLYYTYKINNKGTWSTITKSVGSFATGNDDGIDDEAGNGGYYVVDDENTAYISGTVYDGKTTDKNPIVITTTMLEGLNNNKGNDNPTWFEYTIYDSTEGCADWSGANYKNGRLSAKFKVALNVQYNDELAPKVAIRPFYWNSRTENSVVWDNNSGKPLGHIELEGDLTEEIRNALGEEPKVSGKIKIEGYAFDNIKLKELYVTFDGHKDIGSKVPAATYGTNGIWDTATGIGDTWDFEANDVFNNSEGHLVYWTLTVDTQAVSGTTSVARLDQKVTVVAKDERGKQGTTSGGLESATGGTSASQKMLWKDVKSSAGAASMFYTDEACTTKVNSAPTDDTPVYLKEKWDYQMDIVPYVTGVKTSLSGLEENNPSSYNRTALGHYAVNATETVDIYGFNLSGGMLNDSANTSVSLGTAKSNSSENAYGLSGAQYFSVSASTLKSGKIQIKVNNIPTLNNINKSDAKGDYLNTDAKYENHYNRTPNGLNNNLLEDDVIFDVWEFDSDAATPISGQVRQPIMKISPATGMIQFAYANGPLYFSMGGGNYLSDTTSHDFWSQSYDFFTSIGYTVDDLGYTYGVCAGGDINDHSADVFVLHSSRFGNPNVNRRKHGNIANKSGLGLEQIAQNNGGTYYFLKERILSPSMGTTVSVDNNNTYTNLYLAYIDNINSEIRFKSGTTSASDSTQEFGLFKDKYHTDNDYGITPGVRDIQDVDIVKENVAAESLSLGVVPSSVANNSSKDVVVLVWYEGTTLKYAYNETPLQSGTVGVNNVKESVGTWTVENGPFGSGVGKYCKVAVDKNGGIHVAAYDQMKGDLKYAYRSRYKSETWQTCTVDSYGIIGSEISLEVAMDDSGKPIPYISYYADSAVRPKLAYLVNSENVSDGATRDFFTKNWEVTYLPTSSIVPKDHINVGLWKNAENGQIVDSMIAGSSGTNSFTNWQKNYGSYKEENLVTKGTGDSNTTRYNYNNDKKWESWGYKFANGTKNPMVAYQVGSGVSSTIETAQMK